MAKCGAWNAAAAVGLVTFMALAAGSVSAQAPAEFNYQRAIHNYQAVQSGTKRLDQLTPHEQSEVFAVARMIARPSPPKNTSECRSAWDAAASAASEVADTAQRLQRCVEQGDFTDDCASRFRRVKSAYSDYEGAVSDVSSYCE